MSGYEDLYRDLPLEDDALNVRLLEILPGHPGDLIQCRLVVVRLSGCTRFEALSYTWGAPKNTQNITVNNIPLRVLPSLKSALHYIRRRKRVRRVWCDALCINQLNLEERATQVAKMGQIYRNAEQVLIWLGDGNRSTAKAFRYIRWCLYPDEATFEGASRHCLHLRFSLPHRLRLKGFACPECQIDCKCEECVQAQLSLETGMADLLGREWWNRMWVVQEVAMAAADPRVCCGSSSIAWSELMKYEQSGFYWPADRGPAAQLNQIRLDVKTPPRLRGRAEPLTYSSTAAMADDVFHWLQRTANREASDPRDKVYALLGMARTKCWRELRPDYTESIQSLQYKLVRRMIMLDKNLDILTLCQPGPHLKQIMLGQRANFGNSTNTTATWVPDFSVQGLPHLATINHLPNASPVRIVAKELGTAQPVVVDTLEMSDTGGPPSGELGILLEVEGLWVDCVQDVQLISLDQPEHSTRQSEDAIIRTLYDWSSVWRAIDPAYLRTGGQLDADAYIEELKRYLTNEFDAELYRIYQRSLLEGDKASQKATGDGTKDRLQRYFDANKEDLQTYLESNAEQMEEMIKSQHAAMCALDIWNQAKTLKLAMTGRVFFRTHQDLLGIGPAGLRRDDIVVMLNCSSAMFALRKWRSRYVLVGSVFVDTPPPPFHPSQRRSFDPAGFELDTLSKTFVIM